MAGNKAQKKGILAITLNLGMASALAGLVIGGVYYLTSDRIVANRKALAEEAMRSLVPAAESFRPVEGKQGRYDAIKGGEVLAEILPAEGKGYGGKIKILAAADSRGRLLGFEIVSHNETPGLGDRATDPAFKAMFAGRGAGEFAITKTGESGKIDALAGATITSRGVAKALDEALGLAFGPSCGETQGKTQGGKSGGEK